MLHPRWPTTPPSPTWSPPTAASCTPTATGCSARSTTPRTRCRRRCCARGGRSARFEGRSSLRSWLYTIATNTCLTQLQRRPKRTLPVDFGPATDPADGLGVPLEESVWLEPYPDAGLGYEQREGVELAFIAALQHLPATQRAVLILREVLGFCAAETAEALDTTVASVNSALQRARKAVEERTPERSQQATLRELGDERLRAIVERYMDAMGRADVDAVVAMLAEDAAWSMPPLAAWFGGLDRCAAFLAARPAVGRVALAPPAGLGQRAARRRRPTTGTRRGHAPPVRARRADAGGRPDPPDHRLHHAHDRARRLLPLARGAARRAARLRARSGCPPSSDERQRANYEKSGSSYPGRPADTDKYKPPARRLFSF